jgi:hypothetical protein
MGKTTVEKITERALTEARLNVKTARRSIEKPNRLTKSEFAYEPKYFYIVSIEDKPISKQRFLQFDPDIKFTKGLYTIQYIPKADFHRNPKFPYLIGQDLVRLRVTVSGPKHWGALCERIPELGWVNRNSTLNLEMFAIAKKHPGLVIRFGIDFVKYCRKIEAIAEKDGIDIDHKPLFTYAWNKDVRKELNQVDIEGWKKTSEDYRTELEQAEHSRTVQAEIKEASK